MEMTAFHFAIFFFFVTVKYSSALCVNNLYLGISMSIHHREARGSWYIVYEYFCLACVYFSYHFVQLCFFFFNLQSPFSFGLSRTT